MAGPLAGVRIIEFEGLGPAPFAGMMLADHGAEVIRITRPGHAGLLSAIAATDVFARSRRRVAIDMKSAEGLQTVRDLCASAHGLIEGFRPGVMERLGLGPDVLLGLNPALVYGRITGWGQDGPLAQAAGHDINYIAINGVLHTVGVRGGKPVPPMNYVGDFGGGGMLLAFGMVAALLAAKTTGAGQVIDAAMVDGSALLSGMTWQLANAGAWNDAPGTNWLDGGSHFYDTYVCSDGGFVAIGAIEPQFYALLRGALGLADDPDFDAQMDPAGWPALKDKIAAIIATETRDHWTALMEGTDICFAPVMTLAEAPGHHHVAARGTFIQVGGQTQPAPAPRFSGAPAAAPVATGTESHADAVLAAIGYDPARISALRDAGVVR
ncbi:CaiB/BaiF CoA transferase family protein [Sphingomonas immobilis]|uniref:CaiB/BaiF CoA-transferase family protein n=1 Tax=Sphingomonas immobilis TaxID=3063997 RepID=A0ABT8ZXB3_9SPHN|nr:CaiB/BaiF CoA-transferase family protein [Sphingomonas sp. CA1-15]MDO7842217.1 CaiB/BaiF CoA-transferase family protein [Sphingomonas sp. CA1-15]